MRARTRSTFLKLGCIALASLVVVSSSEARTRRYRKRSPVVVALQPFLLARSVVHSVADPIVYHAPRVMTRVAIAPIRVAYQTTRSSLTEIVRGEMVDESDLSEGEPIREPYYTSDARLTSPPHAEAADESDFDSANGDDDDERPTVAGNRAVLRNGIAQPPANAPANVKKAILATNSLRRKPYIWGGGHGSFNDRGYDCSGTVSFALHHAGLLSAPLPSSDLMRYGERGRGRWITIYSRPGHTFATIAGLRLDTTDFRNGGNVGPRWHADMRDTHGYVVRHPVGL